MQFISVLAMTTFVLGSTLFLSPPTWICITTYGHTLLKTSMKES